MNDESMRVETKTRTIVLVAVVAMTFMATLDASIVNVALPVFSEKLNVSISAVECVIASYSIIICSTILFWGRLGDMYGKSNIFQLGTALFTVSSLLCGLSGSFATLIVCRFLQGIGAAAYMANNHGMITELFPRESRGKALGVLVTAVALGNMVGPSVGGMILSSFNWNGIFFINVPIGVGVFVLGRKYLRKSQKMHGHLDIGGAILQFVSFSLCFSSLIVSQQIGWSNPYSMPCIGVSLALFVLFIYVENRQAQPLLDLDIFKKLKFTINLGCALTSFVCIASSSILIPFYLQNALKLGPFYAGLLMMLSPLVLAICSPIFGSISDRVTSEKVIIAGLLVLGLGFFCMSRLTETSPVTLFAASVAIMAIGQAIFQPANNALVMSSCSKHKLGIVGSVNSLVRNLGQTIGITLSTTMLYCFMSSKAGYRISDYVIGHDEFFIFGMQHVYMVLVAICLLGACLAGVEMRLKANAHNG